MARKRFRPKPAKVVPGAAEAAAARAAQAASRVATINLDAMTGRADIAQGSRVRIGSGLYMDEFAIVESVIGGVIPAAVVRTESGATRRVRTIDLVPAPLGEVSGEAPGEAPGEADEGAAPAS
jgi:hypothetical protein